MAIALGTAGLLGLFIVMPLGTVLIESFAVSIPVPRQEMRALLLRSLGMLEADRRQELMQRWLTQVTDRQRMEATAAALEAIGLPVSWDRKAAFDGQIASAQAAVARLDPAQRTAFEAEYPIQVVAVHRRIPLAFQVRDRLTPGEFDTLRSGQRRGFGLDHYRSFLTEERFLRAGRNSLSLSLTSSALAMVLAYALAFGVNRDGLRFPTLTRAAVLVPLVSPPVILAFAAILLFGRQGLVTRGLLDSALGLIHAEKTNLYGASGVVLAQVLSYLPHAFIVLENVLSQQDARVEEAAASQGATAWQVFSRVTLALTLPGIVRAFLLVFILCMTDFGNPLVIGRDIPVLAGIIYDEILGFQNKPLASALCIWLLLPTLTAYLLFEGIGKRRRFATSAGTGGRLELPVPRAARIALEGIAALVLLLIGSLYLVVVAGSFVRVWGIDFTPTLDHYLRVDPGLAQLHGLPTVWTSVKIAGFAAPLGGLLSLVIAYLVERVRPPGGNAIGFVALLPAVLPGVILGIGYLIFFNNPFGLSSLALTGSAAILVINILFANLYVGVLAGRAALQRLDPAVEEAAEALGASVVQTFRLVTLPMIRRVLTLSTLYVFVHGITTLSAVIFLVSPEHKLASVGIFIAAETAHYGIACATSTAVLVIVLGAMALAWMIERWDPVRRRSMVAMVATARPSAAQAAS
jgi:iron(III) transport system permease protein